MRIEGVENIGTQQMGSQLKCVKCFKNLSLYLSPLGFLQTFPYPPPKLLVYLICKHIIYYNCIDNSRKLCPIYPSTDMEIDNIETPAEPSIIYVKKLIEELLADTPVSAIGENLEEVNESTTSIFLQLSDKIDNAETKNEVAF
ncbi:hypothetical protein RhiirC2_787365 [Rhizophagus irregularis]|uniref:Uncharacterized protein n=1 Tax=Rhizophagus irregularis TaxID=588596 RepID=A0A2N1MSD8_9GLOM|nr:hypothetical protein RhiirC2_787365 [Rhizophagus irregularis]